jgi:hypothetical protein
VSDQAVFEAIHDLVGRQREHGLTLEEAQRLEGVVLSSREALRLYAQYVREESSLKWWATGRIGLEDDENGTPAAGAGSLSDAMILPAITQEEAAADSPVITRPLVTPSPAAPRALPARRRSGVRRYLYAAAVLFPLICGALIWQQLRPRPVGVLTASTDTQWEGTAPAVGEALPAQRTLILKSGVATIGLRNQATLSVAGPAQIELNSATDVFLTLGKIVVDVPHQVSGFSVRTHDAKVVDLGTEFGVSVNEEGSSEVHVLAGRVAVSGPAAGASQQIVAAGSACRVDESGRNQAVPLDVSRFAFAARPDGPSPYDRWLAYGQELRRDPDLVGYYTFEKNPNRPDLLINSATLPRASDATIENAHWDQGRFPGKPCVSFSAPDQRITLNVPGQFRSLTFWAWVRTQRSPRPYSAIVASLDADPKVVPGQLHHWSLLDDGRFDVAFKCFTPTAADPFRIWQSTKPAIDWRSSGWKLVAFTIDGDTVCFYCDGAQVGAAVTPVTPVTPLAAEGKSRNITIGQLQIGNFTEPMFDQYAPRNLHGSVDELGIVGRVMSAEQIKRLYEASKP